ncbi:MAG: metallophosphoesterase family protein [Bacteroidota bacterium]
MMLYRISPVLILMCFWWTNTKAETDKYRCMWRDDPSSTMVVAWNQITGERPTLYYDTQNRGGNPLNYTYSQKVHHTNTAKGMNNHFVRLQGLQANTTYYFLIADTEGCSKRMSFQTASDQAVDRLSIIAGGDSRNHRDARRNANIMVGKLRAHVVMFAGDMTGGDTSREWQQWFNDWQLTISPDGRLTPILAARGNHEASNESIIHLFDVPNEEVYYSLRFGGDLLRTYTLNSLIPAGGKQKEWLEQDLIAHPETRWKIAQYHHSMLPHTREKPENWELYKNWANVFFENRVNLVVESDAHVVKTTYPIRPSKGLGSEQGFIRDDQNGTVYVGEGCWGAPLRRSNDDKKWTRASGSFNQFKLIFVGLEKIEVRTIMVDNAKEASAVAANNIFRLPPDIKIWTPDSGAVLKIKKKKMMANNATRASEGSVPASASSLKKTKASALKKIYADNRLNAVKVSYKLESEGEVEMSLLNKKMQRIRRATYLHVNGGQFLESFDLSGIPAGSFILVLKCDGKVIGKYEVVKR